MTSTPSNSSSVFRGLHYNSASSSAGGPSTGLHFHLLHHHQSHPNPPNFTSNLLQGPSNIAPGNQTVSSAPTAVSLPAPAPVPGKSGINGKLSHSSKSTISRTAATNTDQMQGLVAKLWFDHNLESSLSSLEKDEHDKRLKDMQKQLEYISDTKWKFMPIEKYIGQI